jgi:hypothetical protein
MRTSSLLVVVVAVAAVAGALLSANLPRKTTEAATPTPAAGAARATFAGGCFWCMVPPFDRLDGVLSVTSGYTGGNRPNPDYEQVSTGKTAFDGVGVNSRHTPEQFTPTPLPRSSPRGARGRGRSGAGRGLL